MMAIGDSNLTLLIRHMPREFSDDDKKEFLQHFGAVTVKTVCSGGKRNEIVFASFPSAAAARAALLRLHQMEVMGCHLIVEYSHSKTSIPCAPQSSSFDGVDTQPDTDKRQRLQDQFMRRLVSWSSKLNLSQPPPSHLYYQYPPPTPATLSNISKALCMYPRLYTQLLHLMNRMNLPPPFQDGLRHTSTRDQETQTDFVWVQKSSSESEMESEEEHTSFPSDKQASKRIISTRKVKPIKRPRFIKPALPSEAVSSISLKPEEVFEKTETEVPSKKIELRLSASLQSGAEIGDTQPTESLPLDSDPGGFGLMHPTSKPHEAGKEEKTTELDFIENEDCVISAEQLASNRIPQKDLQVLPVFKNYSPGAPSCRLYVKNVSKHAVARDLHYIYRRYCKISGDEEEEMDVKMFDVRLMTEGRMKGQAFITLPTVKLAQQALTETNGYILKDKPLVVQFARSAPAPVASSGS